MAEKRKAKSSPHAEHKTQADEIIALQLLGMIDATPSISQHRITMKTGLAAGLVHSFMRKVVGKGWVKAKKVSPKRWLYYLTPEGFVEKSRLTMNYLSRTLQNYRDAQMLIQESLEMCLNSNRLRLVVAGDNELGKIASLNIRASGKMELVGVLSGLAESRAGSNAEHMPFEALEGLAFDMVLVCEPQFLDWWVKRGNAPNDQRLLHINLGNP